MGQFQPGKWTLGFVGSLLLAAGLDVAIILWLEPQVGRLALAAAFGVAPGVALLCMGWVQKRYGRPSDR